MMFDMAALVNGQANLQTSAGESSDSPRTIAVPCLPEEPTLLASIVAVELSVQPHVKQELLEMPSALARLQREAEILAEETPQLQERLQVQHRRRFSAFGMSN
jgi:hypothetical protein